jgi:hypothetical protein
LGEDFLKFKSTLVIDAKSQTSILVILHGLEGFWVGIQKTALARTNPSIEERAAQLNIIVRRIFYFDQPMIGVFFICDARF